MYELPDDSDGSTAFAFLEALWRERVRRNRATPEPPFPPGNDITPGREPGAA